MTFQTFLRDQKLLWRVHWFSSELLEISLWGWIVSTSTKKCSKDLVSMFIAFFLFSRLNRGVLMYGIKVYGLMSEPNHQFWIKVCNIASDSYWKHLISDKWMIFFLFLLSCAVTLFEPNVSLPYRCTITYPACKELRNERLSWCTSKFSKLTLTIWKTVSKEKLKVDFGCRRETVEYCYFSFRIMYWWTNQNQTCSKK